MTKAKKGLIITLFAAMMVFAFGATSAFATVTQPDGAVWADDFSTVTKGGITYPTTMTLQSNGQIKAEANDADFDTKTDAAPVYFYDLTGAQPNIVANFANQTSFENKFDANGKLKDTKLVLKTPEYVDAYAEGGTIPKTLTKALVGWTVEVALPDSYVKKADAQQTVTLVADIEATGVANGTEAKPYRVDTSIVSKDVLVNPNEKTYEDINFYADEAIDDNLVAKGENAGTKDAPYEVDYAFDYDGAAHKIVNNTVEGVTVAYSVLNTKTGKYDPAGECPAITNVGDVEKVMATISYSETVGDVTTKYSKYIAFDLSVTSATRVQFGFDADGNDGEYAYKLPEGQIFDVNDFITFEPINYEKWVRVNHQWVRVTHAVTDADKAAVAANEAELQAWFKERYDIEQTSKKVSPNVYTLTIKAKKLSTDEQTALEKKYKDLFAEFESVVIGEDEATLTFEAMENTQFDDITFTYAPNATYKVKKAKKLKKAKSFTVVAEAKSGNAVTYKLTTPNKKISIDPATGKITVKKGLKKGTYKVTVKAMTEAGNGYRAAKESVKLTIKVKK